MSDMPTIRDELDRKTAETLTWLAMSVEQGKITEHQFGAAVDAVFMATSGLTSDAMVECFTVAQELSPKTAETLSAHFHRDTELLTISRQSGELQIALQRRDALNDFKVHDLKVIDSDDPTQMLLKWEGLKRQLISRGYVPL